MRDFVLFLRRCLGSGFGRCLRLFFRAIPDQTHTYKQNQRHSNRSDVIRKDDTTLDMRQFNRRCRRSLSACILRSQKFFECVVRSQPFTIRCIGKKVLCNQDLMRSSLKSDIFIRYLGHFAETACGAHFSKIPLNLRMNTKKSLLLIAAFTSSFHDDAKTFTNRTKQPLLYQLLGFHVVWPTRLHPHPPPPSSSCCWLAGGVLLVDHTSSSSSSQFLLAVKQ